MSSVTMLHTGPTKGSMLRFLIFCLHPSKEPKKNTTNTLNKSMKFMASQEVVRKRRKAKKEKRRSDSDNASYLFLNITFLLTVSLSILQLSQPQADMNSVFH